MNQIVFDAIWTGVNMKLVLAALAFGLWLLRFIHKKNLSK